MNLEHWQVKLAYPHFAQRLEERYGMIISLTEYGQLCRSPYETIKHLSKHKKVVKIIIAETPVIAIKDKNRYKCLITVLPWN
jgi:hypothetical protein